jgi:hypothetical protein
MCSFKSGLWMDKGRLIWGLLEHTKELSKATKKRIEKSRKEFQAGKIHTFNEIKARLNLK